LKNGKENWGLKTWKRKSGNGREGWKSGNGREEKEE